MQYFNNLVYYLATKYYLLFLVYFQLYVKINLFFINIKYKYNMTILGVVETIEIVEQTVEGLGAVKVHAGWHSEEKTYKFALEIPEVSAEKFVGTAEDIVWMVIMHFGGISTYALLKVSQHLPDVMASAYEKVVDLMDTTSHHEEKVAHKKHAVDKIKETSIKAKAHAELKNQKNNS